MTGRESRFARLDARLGDRLEALLLDRSEIVVARLEPPPRDIERTVDRRRARALGRRQVAGKAMGSHRGRTGRDDDTGLGPRFPNQRERGLAQLGHQRAVHADLATGASSGGVDHRRQQAAHAVTRQNDGGRQGGLW